MGNIASKYAFMPPNPFGHDSILNELDELSWIKTQKYGNMIPYYHINGGNKWTFLYSHGNAEDIITMKPLLKEISMKLGIDVIFYDYSGYCFSYPSKSYKTYMDLKDKVEKKEFEQEIKPNEYTAYDDIESVYSYMIRELKINPKDIIIMGRSLGTGPSSHLAATLSKKSGLLPSGLILQSPFLSAIRVVLDTKITLPMDIFPNLNNVPKTKFPVFIIHGTKDTVIDVEHGRQLELKINHIYQNEIKKSIIIEDAGHNNIETAYHETYYQSIQEFLYSIDNQPPRTIKPKPTTSVWGSFSTEEIY